MASSSNTPSDKSTVDTTYATQFFGFTPKSLCDALYNIYYDRATECVQVFQQLLKEEWPQLETDEQLRLAGDKLLDTFLNDEKHGFNRVFDKLEIYLKKNIFCIPPNVLLPEDEVQRADERDDSDSDAKLDAEIEELQKELDRMKALNAHGRHEIARLEVIEKDLEKREKDMLASAAEASKARETYKANCKKLERIFEYLKDASPSKEE